MRRTFRNRIMSEFEHPLRSKMTPLRTVQHLGTAFCSAVFPALSAQSSNSLIDQVNLDQTHENIDHSQDFSSLSGGLHLFDQSKNPLHVYASRWVHLSDPDFISAFTRRHLIHPANVPNQALLLYELGIPVLDVKSPSLVHQYSRLLASNLQRFSGLVNCSDMDGNVPLHECFRGNMCNVPLYFALVNIGADQNIRNKFGVTPLQLISGDPTLRCALFRRYGTGIDQFEYEKKYRTLQQMREFGWRERELVKHLGSRRSQFPKGDGLLPTTNGGINVREFNSSRKSYS